MSGLIDPSLRPTLEKLRKVRSRKDLSIRPTPLLRKVISGIGGGETPLNLRYYQVQMIIHLLMMRRFVVGDDCGLGKTVECIAALCYIWEKQPDLKAVVFTKKSVIVQWAGEFNRFTQGVDIILCKGTPPQRREARKKFKESTGPTVLIMGYRSACRDFADMQDWNIEVLVLDECTVAKNPKTQVHQVCRHLSAGADRVWGLTATLIKNTLVEGFGIYKVIVPGLFSHSMNAFMRDYCILRMQPIGKGRQVPVIVGYRNKDVQRFREKISPYYLGRPKHEVASELPPLTVREIQVGMTGLQHLKYEEALSGLLLLGTGEEKETTKLTQITYCQEIVNHPCLIGLEGESEKLNVLTDLLTNGGEFDGQKVIIFTRFKKMVDFAVDHLEKKGVKCLRVTGAENEDQRQEAMNTFQDHNSGTNVIWITMAGGDAINLQSAKVEIFYDTPFSAGDYLQCLGRMIRIGSIHDRVYAIHLVSKGTVDERVLKINRKKMKLLESVLGKRIKGETAEKVILDVKGGINELFEALLDDARKIHG